jgi:hypothetical protein
MQRSAAIVTEERAARIKLCPLDNWERAPETSESIEHCVPEKRDDAAAFFSIRHPPLSLAGGGISIRNACMLFACAIFPVDCRECHSRPTAPRRRWGMLICDVLSLRVYIFQFHIC